ncbi:bifunctional riboflavin kinase/FMN adenylyltransferase [Malacoplasma penetrans]|uniref:Riboflavin biosynthesis protein n=1 Tax=Malacoplasma penetrans (strain HF-2) TaxID=272633 RepID=Q8EUJ5_MALP2|nr:riboflavin kinase [Malacoplasma penetrans]RXY97132.1 bifunctional riboflavin kinase/FMN adenylyltransferase [Malacoplasma penetrans]BAC44718.1 riboflavin kinase-FAD synthetase [Malacoplasma penetrans HF-2]
MKIIKINLPFNNQIENTENLVLGHFNLIHYGHHELFKELKNFSFLIFENNPSKFKRPYSLDERIENLSKFNPEYIFVYDILKNNIDADVFIKEVLLKIKPKNIVVGSDFCFGKNKKGNVELLKSFFNLKEIYKNEFYSSRNIIELIESGFLEKANEMMMFNFYYSNVVIKGKGLASELDVPTANIEDNKDIKIPSGSYSSITLIDDKLYKSISFIGIPKSFENTKPTVETHIFDFNQDIYNKKIKIYPIKFIRPNQKFDDIKTLIKFIKNDCDIAKKFLSDFDLKKIKY